MRERIRSLWKRASTYVQEEQQYAVVIALYLFHLAVLTQRELVFPFQLLPSRKGHFTGVGWDSLAGIFSILAYQLIRRRQHQSGAAPSKLPALVSKPAIDEAPWKLPRESPRHRLTVFITSIVLVNAYFATGRFSVFWEDTLYTLSGLGFPITAPMQRSLCILLGHMSWLLLGAFLLRWLPRPPKFFQSVDEKAAAKDQVADDAVESSPFVWFKSTRRTKWLWWVIGGYFVSGWLFNVSDLANQFILPESVLEESQESVVSQLVNPEHNDLLSVLVGAIAPCVTAPWWEEVLYRGFALPALTQLLGYRWAVFVQGIIFSAHHMSLSAALPLAVLGWTWAMLYTLSGNLWVVVAVHSLWNSRVFLGNWMGL